MLRTWSWVAALGCACACSSQSVPKKAAPVAIAASWDGGVITIDEVRAEVLRLPPSLVAQYKSPEGQRQFVEAILAKRLLFSEAKKRRLHETEDIRRQVRELEERLVIQALLDDSLRSAPPPSDAELRSYFDEHLDDFRTRPRVRVARVLIRAGSNPAQAKARAAALRARLAKGEPLERIAPQGEGPERTNRGALGWLDDEAPLFRPAFALPKVGAISEVIETPDGFSVLVLQEKEEARAPSFEEARQVVLGRLGPVRQRRLFDELVRRLREENQASVSNTTFQ